MCIRMTHVGKTRTAVILDELAEIVARLQDDAQTAMPWIDSIEGRLDAIEKRQEQTQARDVVLLHVLENNHADLVKALREAIS